MKFHRNEEKFGKNLQKRFDMSIHIYTNLEIIFEEGNRRYKGMKVS